jgi:hypothetical protein
VVKVVRSSLDGQVNVFATEVRLHVALKETAKAGRSILDYDSASPSAEAYRHLAREVLTVCGDEPSLALVEASSNLLELPILATSEAEPEPELVAVRSRRAYAPSFGSFVSEGWQRWLGATS